MPVTQWCLLKTSIFGSDIKMESVSFPYASNVGVETKTSDCMAKMDSVGECISLTSLYCCCQNHHLTAYAVCAIHCFHSSALLLYESDVWPTHYTDIAQRVLLKGKCCHPNLNLTYLAILNHDWFMQWSHDTFNELLHQCKKNSPSSYDVK